MPRVTNKEYLRKQRLLRQLWVEMPSSFGYLKPKQQWELHTYYQTAQDLSDDELLELKVKLHQTYPSLANRAGKAFDRYESILKGLGPNYRLPRVDKVVATGVMRPKINERQLARALISLALEQLKNS